jgi:hypothetical protein
MTSCLAAKELPLPEAPEARRTQLAGQAADPGKQARGLG